MIKRKASVTALWLIFASTVVSGSGNETDDWKDERWSVEAFTGALGGGPAWGPAKEAGLILHRLVQDKKRNIFAIPGDYPTQWVDIITPQGMRYRLAGTGEAGFRDGLAEDALFRFGGSYGFTNLGVDDRGNVFVADRGNRRVRRIFKDDQGLWRVETWAGGGNRSLQPGESCPPLEASLQVVVIAVADDGTVTVPTGYRAYRITPDGKTLTCLGEWEWDGSVAKGEPLKLNLIDSGYDRHGNVYVGARSPNVVCKITPDGKLSHIIGNKLEKRHGEAHLVPDGPPLAIFYDTPASMMVDPGGQHVYLCGGDELDIRRVPTDLKSTSATLLTNGRWYVFEKSHPNKSRGKSVFDPNADGVPKSEGGTLTTLNCAPLVGIDREGNLYGRAGRSNITQHVAGRGLLETTVFKIVRIRGTR